MRDDLLASVWHAVWQASYHIASGPEVLVSGVKSVVHHFSFSRQKRDSVCNPFYYRVCPLQDLLQEILCRSCNSMLALCRAAATAIRSTHSPQRAHFRCSKLTTRHDESDPNHPKSTEGARVRSLKMHIATQRQPFKAPKSAEG